MVLITIVTGAYKPTYNWGASHCRGFPPKNRHVFLVSPGFQDRSPRLEGVVDDDDVAELPQMASPARTRNFWD